VFDGTAVFGRPYAFGPDVPADRLAAVRKAFLATMKDSAFLADAERQRLDMRYRTAEELESDVKQIYATPPEVMKKAAKILVR
jgi:tripartite-type tricarboxylate transporter receptor subunit TctC